jgi:hypothetical protein
MMTAKKQRPAMPELPPDADELNRPDIPDVRVEDDAGTIDENLNYVPPPPPPAPEPSRELVYAGDDRHEQLAYAVKLYRTGRPYLRHCPTNLNLGTTRGRAMLANAAQPGELALVPGHALRVRVHWWVVMPDRSVNPDTGEVSDFMRTCLIDAAGKVYRTSSEYAPGRVSALQDCFTPEEWERGIPVVIEGRPSKRHPGGTAHYISVDMEALPDAS